MKSQFKIIKSDDLPDGSVVLPTKLQPSPMKTETNSGFNTVVRPAHYIGSFLVDAPTQKERTEIVYKKLESMRNASQKKSILLVISLSGIKVCNETGESVRMAHALRRISYATSDPDFCQFSFLAREPKGQANAQYCHTFITDTPNLAEELNDIVGEAFRLAYTRQKQLIRGVASKTPSFNEIIERQLQQQQRPHTDQSSIVEEVEVSGNIDPMIPCTCQSDIITHLTSTTSSSSSTNNNNNNIAISRTAINNNSNNCVSSAIIADDDNYNLLASELPKRPSHGNGKNKTDRRSTGTENSSSSSSTGSSWKRHQQQQILANNSSWHGSNNSGVGGIQKPLPMTPTTPTTGIPPSLLDHERRQIPLHRPSGPTSIRPPDYDDTDDLIDEVAMESPHQHWTPYANRHSHPHQATQQSAFIPLHPNKHQIIANIAPITPCKLKEIAPLPPQRNDSLPLPSYDLPSSTERGCAEGESGVGTATTSLPSKNRVRHLGSDISGLTSMTPTTTTSTNTATGSLTSTSSGNSDDIGTHHHQRRCSHENCFQWPERWYQPDMPRDVALEMLLCSQMGSFVVRDSTSHSGCYALSLRVSKTDNVSGVIHYLIQKTSTGFRLKGLDKEWPTMKSLVTHLSVMPEMLPCALFMVSSKHGHHHYHHHHNHHHKQNLKKLSNTSNVSPPTHVTTITRTTTTNPSFCPIDLPPPSSTTAATATSLAGSGLQNKTKHQQIQQQFPISSPSSASQQQTSESANQMMLMMSLAAAAAEDDDDMDYQRLSDFSSIMADLSMS